MDHDRSKLRFVFQEKLNEDASDENVVVRIGQEDMWYVQVTLRRCKVQE